MDCHRHTERTEKEKKKLINRLNRIEGQIRGIKKMIENDNYCNDILIQTASIGAALNSFNKELLKSHMKTCVLENIKNGNEDIIDEVILTIQKLMK